MARPTRVALALGAGGARGYAHIGVIQVLEERGYDIVGVAGTSMGAVIGGLHAAGQLHGYTEWVSSLTQREVLRLLDPTIRAPGAIRAERILAKVSELLDGAEIEELAIPFTAVATDLLAGKEVWFQHGPVDAAIRAAIALPSFISPIMLNGRLLADGGLLNPVPVAATAASSADLTVAVTLAEVHRTAANAAPVQETADPLRTDDRFDWSRRAVAQLFDGDLTQTLANLFAGGKASAPVEAGDLAAEAQERAVPETETGGAADADTEDAADAGSGGGSEVSSGDGSDAGMHEDRAAGADAGSRARDRDRGGDGADDRDGGARYGDATFTAPPQGLRTLDVMQLSLEAMQGAVTRYRLAAYPPDLLITIPRTSARTLDFHRAKELIALGRRQTIAALDGEAPED